MTFQLADLIRLDRYRNEDTRTYSNHSSYTEAKPDYRHNGVNARFEMPTWSIPHDLVNIYEANPTDNIRERYLSEKAVCFPIHPQVLEECGDEPYVRQLLARGRPCQPVMVSPSSSTRTLYVLDDLPPYALKVHFPFRISRYGRRMRDEVVEQAVAVSMELEKGIGGFDADFAFMREVLGISFRNLESALPRGEHWGFLVRDLEPYPALEGRARLIPGFALYGRDYFDPALPPLIFGLMGERDPLTFVLEKIMLPIIRQWITCYLSFGYMMEPHGQNLLLELDESGEIRRMVHRDLSIGIDMRRRRDLDLPDSHLNSYNRMEEGVFASITYDKFIGNHFFNQLVAAVQQQYPHLQAEDFRSVCRETFADCFPENRRYLPGTVHYFSEKRDAFGKPLYEDTAEKPLWRP